MLKWAKTHNRRKFENFLPEDNTQPNLDILIKMGYRASKIQLVGPDKNPETVNEVELADSILLKKPEAIIVKAIMDHNLAQPDKNVPTTTLKSEIPLPPPIPSPFFIPQQKFQKNASKPLQKGPEFSQVNLMPNGFFEELQSKLRSRKPLTDSVEATEESLSEKFML